MVYGQEGLEVYTSFLTLIRGVTRHLPVSANEIIAAVIYPFTVLYGLLTRFIPFLPMSRYFHEVYLKFGPSERVLVLLDQLNPTWSRYYRHEEIEKMIVAAGFINVLFCNRHGYSWTVFGTKPHLKDR